VVLVISCLVAVTLFIGTPKRGRFEIKHFKEQVEWDRKADSLDKMLSPSSLEALAGVSREGTVMYPDTMGERLTRQGRHDLREGILGPRPEDRYVRKPDSSEFVLRYVLPPLLLGFGLVVWLGGPKGGDRA